MALVSPPKPWQRSQPDTIQQQSPVPLSNTATSEQLAQQTTSNSVPASTISQPNSFAYSHSNIGYSPSSMYGPSSYGGSGFGSPYNSMHGYGSYGNSFSSAYSPMCNQWGIRPYPSVPFGNHMDAYKGTPAHFLVNSGHAFMAGIQQHVSTFGRFSQILHMNLDALQMSFSSVLQLLTNASMLRHELAAFFGAFGSIRAIYLLYLKIRNMILNFLGRKSEVRILEFEGLWRNSRQGRWGWMPTFLTISVSLLIIRKLFQYLSSRQPESIQTDSSMYWGYPRDNSTPFQQPYTAPSTTQSDMNATYLSQYDPSSNMSFPNNFAADDF